MAGFTTERRVCAFSGKVPTGGFADFASKLIQFQRQLDVAYHEDQYLRYHSMNAVDISSI